MWCFSNPRSRYQLPLSCQVGWSSILQLRTFFINILITFVGKKLMATFFFLFVLRGISESMDGQGCAILALEVAPKNLIFA